MFFFCPVFVCIPKLTTHSEGLLHLIAAPLAIQTCDGLNFGAISRTNAQLLNCQVSEKPEQRNVSFEDNRFNFNRLTPVCATVAHLVAHTL